MSAMTMEFDGVRELSMEEVDAVSGALGPLAVFAIAVGAGAGAGAVSSLVGQMTDGKPGVNWGAVGAGAAAGAGVAMMAAGAAAAGAPVTAAVITVGGGGLAIAS